MAEKDIKELIKDILAAEAKDSSVAEDIDPFKIDGQTHGNKETGPSKQSTGTAAQASYKANGSGGESDADNTGIRKDVPMVKVESDPKTVEDPSKVKSAGNKPTGEEKGSKEIPGAKGNGQSGSEADGTGGLGGKKEMDPSKADTHRGNVVAEDEEVEAELDTLDFIKEAGKKYLGEKLAEASAAMVAKAKASIKSVVEGVTDLNEDAKVKVTTLFEATVTDAIKASETATSAAFSEIFEEVAAEYHEALSDQVDTYLSYVAKEWLKENKLAVYHGARQQIAENFIEEMREVFERHDLTIPENKANLLEKAVAQIEKLEADVAAQVTAAAELTKQMNEMKKAGIVKSVIEGMVKTDAEKVTKLAEEVAYTDDESFRKKLSVLVEHYFPKGAKSGSEALLEDVSGEKNDKSKASETDDSLSGLASVVTNLAPKLKIAK